MAITQGVCNSFKQELFLGVHDFRATGGDTFKFALYTSAANIGPTTTAYTTSGESVGTNYPAGGATLTSLGTFLSGSTSFIDFQDFIFTNVTVTHAALFLKGLKEIVYLVPLKDALTRRTFLPVSI